MPQIVFNPHFPLQSLYSTRKPYTLATSSRRQAAISEGVSPERNNNPNPAPPRETKFTVIVVVGINIFWA